MSYATKEWEYNRKQLHFSNIKSNSLICTKCGNDEVYYENPRTGNGLYNCYYCGYAAHERKFDRKRFKVRKCILKKWARK